MPELFSFVPIANEFLLISSFVLRSSLFFSFVILDALSPLFKLFFVGVSRFADSNLGPPSPEGFVSADCVLHPLAVELYSIVYPIVSTWGVIRNLMASDEAEWPLLLSEELPEGLSSLERGVKEVSSEATPNVSSSSHLPRVEKSWVTLTYFSKIEEDDMTRMRAQYQIPDDVVLWNPDLDERACYPKFDDMAFYEVGFQVGLRFPLQSFVKESLDVFSLALGQVAPNGWRKPVLICGG